MSGQRELQLNY